MATILFDLDDTLMDTKRLKENIFQTLVQYGAPRELVEITYKESRSPEGTYNLKDHIKLLQEKYSTPLPAEEILEWFENLNFYEYLFPGSHDILLELKDSHTLILLTKGEEEFQKLKIQGSGLANCFDEIFITPVAKEIFLKDKVFTEPVYFINDKISENDIIKTQFPLLEVIDAEKDLKNIQEALNNFFSVFK